MFSCRVLIATFCVFSLSPNPSQAEISPLLTQVHKLHCAAGQNTAKQALEHLRTFPSHLLGLPSETADDSANSFLLAGSLDITLYVLSNTAEKYPPLRNLVERTLLQWQYCNIFENNSFYDVYSNQPRQLTSYQPPLEWLGFQYLGFLDSPATFTPKLLQHKLSRNQSFEMFFHRIYRKQCFPHPETGALYRHSYQTKTKIIAPIAVTTQYQNSTYPYNWNMSCLAEITSKIPEPLSRPDEELPPIIVSHVSASETVILEPTKIKPLIIKSAWVDSIAPTSTTELPTKVRSPSPISYINIIKTATAPPIRYVTARSAQSTDLPVSIATPEITRSIPRITAPTGVINGSPIANVISENPEKTHGFTGNVYIKQGLAADNPTLGASVNWKPITQRFWFIRGGIDYDYKAGNVLSYSWGVGYDDWHEGTWSVQINNWGPISPSEGFSFDKSIVNIGYKFKSTLLESYNLHTNASLDLPISDEPILNMGIQWNPKQNWYIRANLHHPINGAPTNWSYGFGYSDWRVGKINLEYANYGTNQLSETNFIKNGVINMSYNWEF